MSSDVTTEKHGVEGNLIQELADEARRLLDLLLRPDTPLSKKLRTVLAEDLKRLRYLTEASQQLKVMPAGCRYIMVAGEINAGKSALINALVGDPTCRPEHSKKQDTVITLVGNTRFKNHRVQLKTTEKLILIDSKFIDAAILHDAFLIDTPGSGDLAIDNDMVRMFLLAADSFVYLISAEKYLHESDRGNIERILNELSEAPHLFLLTHASKWRVDDTKPTTDANIDTVEQSEFIEQLRADMRAYIKGADKSDLNFVVCDSKHGYRIDEIRRQLFEGEFDAAQATVRKVRRIARLFSGLKNNFLEELERTADQLRELIRLTNKILGEVRGKVELPLKTLQASGIATSKDLARLSAEFAARLQDSLAAASVDHLPVLDDDLSADEERALTLWATVFGQSVSNDLRNAASAATREAKDQLIQILDGGEGIGDARPKPQIDRDRPSLSLLEVDLDSKIQPLIANSRQTCLEKIRAALDRQRTALSNMKSQAEQRYILNKDDEFHNNLERTVGILFEKYVDSIEMLCSHVLISTGVPLLAASGSADRLDVDALSRTRFEDFAREEKTTVLSNVFARRHALRERLEVARAELLDQDKVLTSDYSTALEETRTQEQSLRHGDFALPRTTVRALVNKLSSIGATDINLRVSARYDEFLARIQLAEKEGNRAHARETKSARLGRSKLVALTIFTVAYLGVLWAVNAIAGGIAAALVIALGLGGTFFWRQLEALLDKGLLLIPRSRKRVTSNKRTALIAEIESWSETFEQELGAAAPTIATECVATVKSFISADRKAFLGTFADLSTRAAELSARASNAMSRYGESWFALHSGMSDWYVSFADNDETLLHAAENMKGRCVEPALQLFERRLSAVEAYIAEIRAVNFAS